MKVLVVGGTGATGRILIDQLLNKGAEVNAIVRSPDKIPKMIRDHTNLNLIEGSPLDYSYSDLQTFVKGCGGIASCLGHNLSFKGIYGDPRFLVLEATRKLCEAVRSLSSEKPIRFVLITTKSPPAAKIVGFVVWR